ncbi:HVO_2922 family protein [Halosimplex salinum]|uniref:HVO_2922 family protein n=1 Tax=Halosimplex salinum TaxID=1710538 RepID=UPI000F460B77|nr:HVO_2922 family protein [Halosimplex salinum]
MPEHGDDSNEESRGDAASTDETFESERTATRSEAAAVLRGLADGVDAGAVSIGTGEDALTAALPDEFDFEVEYEREDGAAEIEVELEWATEDEPAEERAATSGEPIEEGDSGEGDSSEGEGEFDSDEGDTDDEDGDSESAGGDDRPAVETATVQSASGDGPTAGDDADEPEPDAGPTPTVEAAAPLASQARFEVFRDRAAEWRWRLVHRNGNVIASSGEGYTRKHNAEKGMRSVMRNAGDADVVEE